MLTPGGPGGLGGEGGRGDDGFHGDGFHGDGSHGDGFHGDGSDGDGSDAGGDDGPRGLVDGAEQRRLLKRGQRLAGLTLEQLWMQFFSLGGDVGLLELEAYLAGMMTLPRLQRDMLAQAVNERLDELPPAHVPYSRTVRPEGPSSAELTALVDLLSASSLASPDQLPLLTDAAFARLGVGVTMYLVDHDQRFLVPAPPADREPLGVDGTVAGRVFQRAEVVASGPGEPPRLWLPLLDGAERLGVLEVHLDDPADLLDLVLREQCQHLGSLLGPLVTTVGGRGDALDGTRRRRPRSPSAELAWQLLPPSSAENESLAVSGWVEPADTAGGDLFDYALAPDRASLVVLDAMGHGLPAALLAAAAVSSYRSARRNGERVLEQVAAVDSVVSGLSPDGGFVTGFLSELDLVSGRLRYVNAGHPDPLLMRDGAVVKALTGGRTVPFGLGALRPTRAGDGGGADRLGHEDLQPGDWLVMYTDGVTEARDGAGTAFGDAGLVEVLQRAGAEEESPVVTARRLARAVLDHQETPLHDDATVLLARWRPR